MTKTKTSIEEIVADKVQLDQVCEDANIGITIAKTEAPDYAPITAEKIDERVGALVQAASMVFLQIEQRHLATNGKAYPVDFDFDARALKDRDGTPIEGTGEIVPRDKFEFLNKNLARLQCSGLDLMLRNQRAAVEKQRNSIKSEIRFGHNRGVDTTAQVERMADFLEHMMEQCSLIEVALNAAVENYSLAFGDDYVPKDQAEQVVAARKASLGTATNDRLTKLGVTA